ncbi:hypothetical protein GGI23_005112, partial [Coemansia sp. RSA 2559]
MAAVYTPLQNGANDLPEPAAASSFDSIQIAGSNAARGSDDVAGHSAKAPGVSDEGLRKEIGLLSASSIVVGQVVGSGIFSTPASIALLCGTPSMALVLWAVTGVFSLGGALASAELGTMFPQNGGMIRYLAHSYPRPRALVATIMAYSVTFFCRPAA